jgi:hypothetical protein
MLLQIWQKLSENQSVMKNGNELLKASLRDLNLTSQGHLTGLVSNSIAYRQGTHKEGLKHALHGVFHHFEWSEYQKNKWFQRNQTSAFVSGGTEFVAIWLTL